MSVKLLTEQHLEFLSLKGGSTGSSESIRVKCHIVGNHISRLNAGHYRWFAISDPRLYAEWAIGSSITMYKI